VLGRHDNHLMMGDLRPKKITGKVAQDALGPRAHHGEQET
jgi:glycine/serine hydroxymethyltransferase